MNYAKAVNRRVHWIVAHDWPVAGGDEDLKGETLERARRRWLQLHDKTTGGIMGLLSLVKGIPMRLTCAVEDARGAFKNARAELVGWELDPSEEARLKASEAPEIEFFKRPLALHLKLKNPTGRLLQNDSDGIFVLKPKVCVWHRDTAGQAPVKRNGYIIENMQEGWVSAFSEPIV